MSAEFRGVIPVLCTPFDDEGEIIEEDFRREIEYCVDVGAHGISIGDASESFKLAEGERKWLIDVLIDQVKDRLPVVVGISASSIRSSVILAQYAESAGADAVFAGPRLAGIGPLSHTDFYAYFATIARESSIPIMIHDSDRPAPIPTSLIARLVEEFEQIRYLKEEMYPAGQKISEVLEICGDRLAIISGLGGRAFVDDLNRGAQGVIPGCHVVKELVEIYDAWQHGDVDAARERHNRVAPLILFRQLARWAISVSKEVLRMRGVFSTVHVRPPTGMLLDEADRSELKAILDSIGS